MSQRRSIGNLPAELSSFVGRSGQLAQLVEVVRHTRLLTLVGPAGVGKTRLALRLGAELRADYPDGVWFLEVDSADEPSLLPKILASVLGVREQAGRAELQSLTDALHTKYALVILDNCEEMVEACSDLISALLRGCPRLSILATSSESLEIDGETAWRVPPLSLPTVTASSPADAEESEAVQLFVMRAQARLADFQLAPGNTRPIVQICHQLDGLPLALELVAAQLGSVAAADAAAQIGDSPALQVSGRQRSSPRRQQALRATLEWSYQLLAEDERVLLRRASIFAGGFDQAAAEAVCAGPKGINIAELLDRLVARSLLNVDSSSGTTRYQLLEVVRAYARERLREAGESEVVAKGQLEYMLALAEQAAPEHVDADHARLLAGEHRNLWAALNWAATANQGQHGLRLATAMCTLWYFQGRYAEGAEWLQRLLRLPNVQGTRAQARAAAWLGQLLMLRGEFTRAARWQEVSIKLHRAIDDESGLAVATAMLAQLTLMQGDLKKARLLCIEAADRQTALGSAGAFNSRLQVVVINIELGQLREARAALSACEPRGPEGSRAVAAWVLFMKGRLADARDDQASAERLLQDALASMREMDEQQAVLVTLNELAHVRVDRQMIAAAFSNFVEAFELALGSGDRVLLARVLEGLGRCAASEYPVLSVRFAAAADGLRQKLNARAWPSEKRRLDSWLPKVRSTLKHAAFESAWQTGRVASNETLHNLVRELQSEPKAEPAGTKDPLTAREREVVQLLARALSNQQIAAELTISPATARTHVDHVLAKLGLHSRGQVVLWASQRSGRGRGAPRRREAEQT